MFYNILRFFYRTQIYLYLIIMLVCGMLLSFAEGNAAPGIIPIKDGQVDIQGHRGARGLFPENSMEGFMEAVKIGVHTLEMDVVITQDEKVVLSHEPWMSATICRVSEEKAIPEESERIYNIYRMDYAQLQQFDCGLKLHADFPNQQKIPVVKPLLSDVIEQVEQYTQKNGLKPIHYNIETKFSEDYEGTHCPDAETFMQLVYGVINDKEIKDRTIIQSFNIQTLKALKEIDPDIKTAILISKKEEMETMIESLGFTPEYLSPDYKLVDASLVSKAHELNMKVVPWTVNETSEILKLIERGVDGIITDYPDRAVNLLKDK